MIFYNEGKVDIVNKIKNENLVNKVYFYFPSYIPSGGGEPFLINLMKYLLDYTNIQVAVIDFIDGTITTNFQDERVEYIAYDPNNYYFKLDENSILFTPLDRITTISRIANRQNVRILTILWETIIGWDILCQKNEINKLGYLLKKKDAVLSIDEGCAVRGGKPLGVVFPQPYLPIYFPISSKVLKSSPKLISKKQINFGWLGRLAYTKCLSLISLLESLYKSKDSRPKYFHIIGNGLYENELKHIVEKYEDKITFIFCGRMINEDRDNYITNNIDVLFAMGTSMLNGAALKIPVIGLHETNIPIFINKFLWIFDAQGLQLGQTNEKDNINPKAQQIDKVIEDIYDKGLKKEFGEKSYNYLVEHHANIKKIGNIFVEALYNTSLTYKDLKKLFKVMPYNSFIKKSIYIFGVSIYKLYLSPREKHFLLFGRFRLFSAKYAQYSKKYYLFKIPLWKSYKKFNACKFYLLFIKLFALNIQTGYSFPDCIEKEKLRGKNFDEKK